MILQRMFNNIITVFAILFIVALVYANYNVNITKLDDVVIHSSKLKDDESIKLLQISDLHDKRSVGSNRQILRLVKRSKADIIVITGDLMDVSTRRFSNIYALVRDMVKINPNLYFVTGDHEWESGKAEEFIKGLKERKVKIVDNKSMIIRIRGTVIDLRGVADTALNGVDKDALMKDMSENVYTIMLSHRPEIVYSYKDKMPDLTLSGHTHGGQIRLPMIGAVVAQGQGFFPKLDKGIFNISEDKLLYVDSGVGTSTLPLRFMNQSHVTLITIEGTGHEEFIKPMEK